MADGDSLNDKQQNAVTHFGSPLLILAGAGSGKTRVITTKIAHLISECGIPAHTIVAVTFTNKAATEMRERAQRLTPAASRATICTFHSFGARMLRQHGGGRSHTVGNDGVISAGGATDGDGATDAGGATWVAPNFTIYDDSDSLSLMKSLFPDEPKARLERALRLIQRAKQHGLASDDPLDIFNADAIGDAFGDAQTVLDARSVSAYYRLYQQKLNEIGNADFGDLILKPLQMLKRDPDLRARMQRNIRVLLVDEYQDTNQAQYQLIQQLYHPDMYLCVVGDDDQSIYAFRGSDVTHIVNFPQYFPHTEVMYLLQNYRSTQHILSLASHVITRNSTRYEKVLYTERTGGQKPKVVYLDDDYQEASYVVEDILQENKHTQHGAVRDGARRDDNALDTAAIVYRTNAQSRAFESELINRGVPYTIVGSVRFYEREEVKDLLAYLKFVANPKDEVALRRVINKPARSIGPVTIQKIVDAAAGEGGAAASESATILYAAASESGAAASDEGAEEGDLLSTLERATGIARGAAAKGCAQFAATVRGAQRLLANGRRIGNAADTYDTSSDIGSVTDILARILELSELGTYYKRIDREKSTFKSENIAELLSSAIHYPATQEGLNEFLERAELEGNHGSGKNNKNGKGSGGNGNARGGGRGASGASAATGATGASAATGNLLANAGNLLASANNPFVSADDPPASVDDPRVILITMHNTKGLEFDTVYIVGLQDGLFPRTIDLDPKKMEEERRLFYVAITRAKRRLVLTTCELRHQYGRIIPFSPSRFLSEIDTEFVEQQWFTGRRGSRDSTQGYYQKRASFRDGGRPFASQGGHWLGNGATHPRANESSAAESRAAETETQPAANDAPRFAVGTTVFHDEYGAGEVCSRAQEGTRYILGVRFSTGRMAHFIEKYAALEKIASD